VYARWPGVDDLTSRKKQIDITALPRVFWQVIEMLADISAKCRETTTTDTAYRETLELVRKIVPYDGATLYLLSNDSGRLEPKVTVSDPVEVLGFLRLGRGQGLSGWAAGNKKPILLKDRSAKSNFKPDKDYASVLSVPLLIAGEVSGALNLGHLQPGAYDENHVRLMTVVADQLAASIEHLVFNKQIEEQEIALDEVRKDLRAAHDRLVATEKLTAVIDLSISINHQINNPLAIIIGNVQCLLTQNAAADQKAQTRLKRIEAAAMRISEVNRKLLRIDSVVGLPSPMEGSRNLVELERTSPVEHTGE
jgi:GAF domain-containing protein